MVLLVQHLVKIVIYKMSKLKHLYNKVRIKNQSLAIVIQIRIIGKIKKNYSLTIKSH